MTGKLSNGWISVPLRDVVLARKGKKPSILHKSEAPGRYPYLLIDQMEGKPPCYFTDDPKASIASKEDVLVVWDGSIGKCATGLKGAVGSTIVALKPLVVNPNFLEAFIKHSKQVLTQTSRGTGLQHINQEVFWDLAVPVAPLAEQCRIVAKLEKLQGKVGACQKQLEKIPVILKRFRQAVLAAACSGRLTTDWRKKNPNVWNAKVQIKEECFSLSEPPEDLPELPETWAWVALGNYARCFRGKFTPRPRNDPRYFNGKHPFIQIGNLPREGGFVTSHNQTLNDEGLAVSRKFPKGTVVIAIVGATIGNTGVLAYDMCATDSLVGMETGTPEGNRYLELFLRYKKYDIRQSSYSSGGQPNIKLEFLNPYPFALPPLPEQQEIVRRVQSLFTLADQIEARYKKAKTYADKLTQSILTKAFCGELVSQDPNDEPASELLKRLRTVQNTSKKNPINKMCKKKK